MLLQTKLYVPVTRSSLVPRPHLLSKLDEGLPRRLTLVVAPAGFGKTTLIARWGRQLVENEKSAFAWVSLDERDNEPVTFCNYVIAALQTINERLGQSASELLQAPQVDNIQIIFTALLNDIARAGQAITLVLDDYHLIASPLVHEGVSFLLDNGPPRFHLVLLSRADPPFSLGRLRARHQMTEIRQDDLRFTHVEALHFLRQLMALDLSETAVSALEERTEGWVAGLQMAALALQGTLARQQGAGRRQERAEAERFIADFSGSHRYIFDYLAEETLSRRPEGTRSFLLQSAVLERLCAPLCDAVLQRANSQALLERLESANLFLLPLDEVRHWYRYHHLFADLLRHNLRREQPELIPILHGRASRWFEEAGFADEAVQHALAASDYERAAHLVAQYSQSLVHQAENGKLLSWIDRLPAEWRHQHPQLIINHAWALLFLGDLQGMEATLSHLPEEIADSLPYSAFLLVLRGLVATRRGHTDEAIALAEKAESQFTTLEPELNNLSMRGVNAMILATGYRMRDRRRAAQYYQKAASLCRESGNLIVFLTAVRDRGKLLLEQGQLHQAEAVFLEGIQFEQQWVKKSGTQGRNLLAAAPIHVSLAQLYYEWNRLDEAEPHLVDAVRLLGFIGPVNQSEGLLALARLRLAQGNAEAVPPLLIELETLQEAANDAYTRRQLAIAVAETYCALFQQESTPDLRQTLERSLATLDDEPMAVSTQGRILLALGRPAQAVSLLEKKLAQMAPGSTGLRLPVAVTLCIASYQCGEERAALGQLRQVLRVAVPAGYLRLFVDWGQAMQPLLELAVQDGDGADLVAPLLAHFPSEGASISHSNQPPPAQAELADPLSPRETEVLQLIAQGLTNKEIGNSLFIAPSTAKRHTANIYNKLGVNNRAEATARAYELGLVSASGPGKDHPGER